MVAINSNGGLLYLACAWVPFEDMSSFLYVLNMLANAGIDIELVPIFTDRGKLLSAVKLLHYTQKVTISLKYCLEHIIRNVKAKFKIPNEYVQLLRNVLANMQTATTVYYFISSTSKFEAFCGEEKAKKIILYLLCGIHLRHWTVFGNLSIVPDSDWEAIYYQFVGQLLPNPVNDDWHGVKADHMTDPVPVGHKFPLFGHSRNNLAEVSVSLATKHGVRSDIPPKAMLNFITLAKQQNDNFFNKIRNLHTDGTALLYVAMKLFNNAKSSESSAAVVSCATDNEGHVLRVKGKLKTYNVVIQQYGKVSCLCGQY